MKRSVAGAVCGLAMATPASRLIEESWGTQTHTQCTSCTPASSFRAPSASLAFEILLHFWLRTLLTTLRAWHRRRTLPQHYGPFKHLRLQISPVASGWTWVEGRQKKNAHKHLARNKRDSGGVAPDLIARQDQSDRSSAIRSDFNIHTHTHAHTYQFP